MVFFSKNRTLELSTYCPMNTTTHETERAAWTAEQLEEYNKNGYLMVRGLLTEKEMHVLNTEAVPQALHGKDDKMHREYERSGAPRTVFLAHRYSPPFQELARHPKILQPVKQILQSEVYVWHSKINVKDAFEGAVWLWHQDHGYWIRDGIDDRILSVMIFLDRSTLNNGCFMVAPGTHRTPLPHYADTVTTSYKQWCVEVDALKKNLKEEMIVPMTGNPGDVLFFHSNVLHGSGHNMSPLPRKTMILVYNSIENKPKAVESPRPDWVVSREFDIVA